MRLDAARDALVRAHARANEMRSPVLAVAELRPSDLPELPGLFASAERQGLARFYAARAEADRALLGLGTAWEVRVTETSSPFAHVRRATDSLLRGAVLARDARPLLVGGAAFEPRAPERRAGEWQAFANACFTLPELLLERRGGEHRVCAASLVRPGAAPEIAVRRALRRWDALLAKPAPELEFPGTRSASALAGLQPDARYRDAVARVLEEIRAGAARKVVLAGRWSQALPGPLRAAPLLRALGDQHAGSLVFAQGFGRATFLGATPEQLVRVHDRELETCALAGTAPRDASGAAARALLGSAKDRDEHQYVVAALRDALAPFTRELAIADEPVLVRAGNVQHLHTPVRGMLAEPRHVLELVERLHPTPALGGTPRDAALGLIRAHEDFDRGWYGGPVGWFDASGDGEFAVALRCALAGGASVALFAGSGLVAASDPDREARETALKLRAFGDALAGVLDR